MPFQSKRGEGDGDVFGRITEVVEEFQGFCLEFSR